MEWMGEWTQDSMTNYQINKPDHSAGQVNINNNNDNNNNNNSKRQGNDIGQANEVNEIKQW